MAIVVTCPSCGKSAQAPDRAAGKSGRCRGCGQSIQVPWEGSAAPAKICTDCGVDVGGQKRTKDTAGRYYCQLCWAAKVQSGAAAALSRQPAVPTAGPTATAAGDAFVAHDFPPLPQRQPAGDADELQTIEECPDCGLSVPVRELVPDHEDRMICTSCARKEVDVAPLPLPALVSPPPVRPVQALPYRTPQPAKPRRGAGSSTSHVAQMLIGGVICVVGVVVTAGTFLAAVAGGGGRYTIAWGAIVFGAWRFFKGLSGALSNR